MTLMLAHIAMVEYTLGRSSIMKLRILTLALLLAAYGYYLQGTKAAIDSQISKISAMYSQAAMFSPATGQVDENADVSIKSDHSLSGVYREDVGR